MPDAMDVDPPTTLLRAMKTPLSLARLITETLLVSEGLLAGATVDKSKIMLVSRYNPLVICEC